MSGDSFLTKEVESRLQAKLCLIRKFGHVGRVEVRQQLEENALEQALAEISAPSSSNAVPSGRTLLLDSVQHSAPLTSPSVAAGESYAEASTLKKRLVDSLSDVGDEMQEMPQRKRKKPSIWTPRGGVDGCDLKLAAQRAVQALKEKWKFKHTSGETRVRPLKAPPPQSALGHKFQSST